MNLYNVNLYDELSLKPYSVTATIVFVYLSNFLITFQFSVLTLCQIRFSNAVVMEIFQFCWSMICYMPDGLPDADPTTSVSACN